MLRVNMYTDPKTNETVLTHPAELQRIPDFRDHGFSELNPIHTWITREINAHDQTPFHETYLNKKGENSNTNYIFVNCTPELGASIPHYKIELEVGFIDFQDEKKMPVSNITFNLHKKSQLITLTGASSYGLPTEDVVRALSDITDGTYLMFHLNK